MPRIERYVAAFRRQYRAIGTPTRAAGEKAYLKSKLRFHGVTVPQIRTAAAAFLKESPELDREEVRTLVDALFATSFHDLHSTAIAILERKSPLLGPGDLPWLIGLVRRAGNWAHVDWLATKVIGPVVTTAPRGSAVLRGWANDDDFWVRRTALLAQLEPLRRGAGDFALFAELAQPMLKEREFFVRKAIGWVLREVAKRRPQLTFDFLMMHRGRVSGLTMREGARALPAALRSKLARP